MFSVRHLFSLLVVLLALTPARIFCQNVVPVAFKQIDDSTLLEGATPQVLTLTDFFTDPDTTGVRLTTDLGVIDFALYDARAPLTVDNFNTYVQSGAYFPNDPTTSTPAPLFVHRAIPGFIIQSGGFVATVDPAAPSFIIPTQVMANPPVQNEPGISNERGTVAMAKLDGDPDSATSQWFINLADNGGPPNNLDTVNGGFTVFGRVFGDGMTVADAIAALPRYNFGAPFDTIPLRDYTSPNRIAKENLVTIPAITYIDPLTYTATSDHPEVAEPTIKDANLLVTPKQQGTATITVTGTDVDGATVSETFDVTIVANPIHLANISTRGFVGTENDALIGGFIVKGDAPKHVVIRARGPSLADSGITDFLADPTIEVRDGIGTLIAFNDNWQDDPSHQTVADIGLAPTEPNEAAILIALPSTSTGVGYTAIVHGADSGSGIGQIEVYDVDSSPGSSVLNISTRGDVQTGAGVMIGGFIVFGDGPQEVVVRAIGPSLPESIANPLADPTLTLYDGEGMQIDFNDNWEDNPAKPEIEASGLQPTNPNESTVLQTLMQGGYTAIVRGTGTVPTGTALVEAYAIQP